MDFKSGNKKQDAWTDITAELKTDRNEVEKKMQMLIRQFQRELKKGKSGNRADAPYKTKWCFFNMLLFLKDKSEPRHTSEGGLSPKQDTDETQDNINAAEEEERSQPDEKMQNYTEKSQEKIVAKTIARMPITKTSKRKAVDMKSETLTGAECSDTGPETFTTDQVQQAHRDTIHLSLPLFHPPHLHPPLSQLRRFKQIVNRAQAQKIKMRN